ncbi:alpha/beta hydrolase-fold protein [Massilia sp. CCM 9210]|uniref:alpha/beta hydrolase n=1 Tax=Massilia scottii TaxID=3057166 RepID=UPI002796A130|nr:alpha/beta hydrolase-fold protein [Massilia sp. CCM 9210]MDQ1813974.1 alpha/beta hydrolase-fold protein [Massilia sp. CCM 9210]
MTLARVTLAAASLLPLGAGATTVRVHYESPKDGITIRGDKGPMSWSKGVAARSDDGKVWTYTWPDDLGDVVMKPALGDEKIAIGGTYKLAAGSTRDIYPFFGAPFGKVKIIPGFASPQLKNSRNLRVYLPPSYDENRAKRYPVLYMHDGQNLFDAKTAAFGVEWGVDETVNRLVATGIMEEIIVVGIDNTPERIAEYTTCCDPQYGGGQLDTYQRFVVDTVKPYIDSTLRTMPAKESTAIMGSSLGGIASVWIAQKNAAVFSKAASVSGSFWWNKQEFVTSLPPRLPVRFYLDAGTVKDGLEDTVKMRDAMLKQGYRQDADLFYHVAEGATHNEKSWAARVDKPLTWFFPWQ